MSRLLCERNKLEAEPSIQLKMRKINLRVNVQTMVIDQVINNFKQKFSEHGSLYADLSCLDSRDLRKS